MGQSFGRVLLCLASILAGRFLLLITEMVAQVVIIFT